MFSQKIAFLQQIKANILADAAKIEELKYAAEVQNKWFTPAHVQQSIDAILTHFFDEEKLKKWLSNYTFRSQEKKVGLILAGNLPLVGFHDILCAFVLNLPTKIKTSSKDNVLVRYIVSKMQEIDAVWQVEFVERLTDYDTVIATGSSNTNRYFKSYFKDVPSLLRSNRTSIAVLTGNETTVDYENLAQDIFSYHGLGCRNVSKLYLPKGFDVTVLFPHFEKNYAQFFEHQIYMDNYDYNRTLLLMNSVPHLSNNFVILKEDESLHARLATVHYEYYDSVEDVKVFIYENEEKLQCVVGEGFIPFGQAQQPQLWDYADNEDTMAFLLSMI